VHHCLKGDAQSDNALQLASGYAKKLFICLYVCLYVCMYICLYVGILYSFIQLTGCRRATRGKLYEVRKMDVRQLAAINVLFRVLNISMYVCMCVICRYACVYLGIYVCYIGMLHRGVYGFKLPPPNEFLLC